MRKQRYYCIPRDKNMCIIPKLGGMYRLFDLDWVEKEINEPYGFIYKITNILNNKIYIGQTTKGLLTRFYQHCKDNSNPNTFISRAIQKYGKENFEIECIKKCKSKKELDEQEVNFILKYNSYDLSIGYNMVVYNKHADKTKIAYLPMTKQNPMQNTSLYEIWLKKFGKQEADRLLLEFKEKQRAIGKYTYETKNEKLTFKGKKHTSISKEKLSKDRKGKDNPMFGKSIYDLWIDKHGYEKAMTMKEDHIKKRVETMLLKKSLKNG